jgi:ribosomal protein S18 acetylase RimI-like enzyme
MSVVHFKRFRMQFDLRGPVPPAPALPPGYRLLPWRSRLLDLHAAAKHASFANELDSIVFACLSTAGGCQQLMRDITGQANFVSQATWLIVHQPDTLTAMLPVATVQGIREPGRIGSIQNVGVAPVHRGLGLGTLLLTSALLGFQQTDHVAATLEVTAKNTAAIRLYQRIGFCIQRIVYRSVELPALTAAYRSQP